LVVLDQVAALALSSLVIGAFVPGVVPLVLGRTQELLPPEGPARQIAWTWCTTAFAVGQAAGAYGLSFLFASAPSYTLLFAIGASLVAAALVLDLVVAALTPERGSGAAGAPDRARPGS
jgi:predicted MFS family arabinose efflux permease